MSFASCSLDRSFLRRWCRRRWGLRQAAASWSKCTPRRSKSDCGCWFSYAAKYYRYPCKPSDQRSEIDKRDCAEDPTCIVYMLAYSILHHRNSLYISHHYYTCYNTKTKPFKVVAHTLPIRSFHVGGIFERTLGLLVSLHRVPNTCETSLPSGSTDSVLGCSGPGCYIHPSSFHPADRLVMSEKHCRSTKLSEQLFEIIDDAVYR